MKPQKIRIVLAPSLSAVKGSDEYSWYTYNGTPRSLTNTKGSKTCRFTKGYVFGIRSSSDGKKLRLITQEYGPTVVFTIGEDLQEKLVSASKKNKGTKAKAEDTLSEDSSTASWYEFSKSIHPKMLAYVKDIAGKGAQDVQFLKSVGKQLKSANKLFDALEDSKGGKAYDRSIKKLEDILTTLPKFPKGKAFKDTKEGKIALAIHKRAVKLALEGLKDYMGATGCDTIYLLGLSDAIDHLVVASYMNQNDFRKADAYRRNLDTSSRDEVHDSFYVYRDKKYEEESGD